MFENIKHNQRGFSCRCPSHEDEHNSLSFFVGHDGKVHYHCHAGCSADAIQRGFALSHRSLLEEAAKRMGHFSPLSSSPPPPAPKRPSTSPSTKETPQGQIEAVYPYYDEQRRLVYEVVRLKPKSFRIRRREGGEWVWNLGNTRKVIYNLPQVIDTAKEGGWVFVVEGEKDADRLISLGLCATTNLGGAGKWKKEYSSFLVGAHVVILPDNDEVGNLHALEVADSLLGTASSVRILNLEGLSLKGDVSDWLDMGHSAYGLLSLAQKAPVYAKQQLSSSEPPLLRHIRLVWNRYHSRLDENCVLATEKGLDFLRPAEDKMLGDVLRTIHLTERRMQDVFQWHLGDFGIMLRAVIPNKMQRGRLIRDAVGELEASRWIDRIASAARVSRAFPAAQRDIRIPYWLYAELSVVEDESFRKEILEQWKGGMRLHRVEVRERIRLHTAPQEPPDQALPTLEGLMWDVAAAQDYESRRYETIDIGSPSPIAGTAKGEEEEEKERWEGRGAEMISSSGQDMRPMMERTDMRREEKEMVKKEVGGILFDCVEDYSRQTGCNLADAVDHFMEYFRKGGLAYWIYKAARDKGMTVPQYLDWMLHRAPKARREQFLKQVQSIARKREN